MKVSLVVMNAGKSAGQSIPIGLADFVIGRDPQCNLRPASALISKRHCSISVRNGSVFVRDFDSTNGTFINDEPLKGEAEVKHDDVLKAGPLQFRVAIQKAASKTPLPPTKKPTPPPMPAPLGNESHEDLAADILGLGDTITEQTEEMTVPDGSTVMDLPLPEGIKPANPADKTLVAAKPEEKKKIDVGAAQSAAAALFAKYNKRTTR